MPRSHSGERPVLCSQECEHGTHSCVRHVWNDEDERENMSDLIVGIDLGTTNSEVAAFTDGQGARAGAGRPADLAVLRRPFGIGRTSGG